jgi:hypothetical protein
MKAIAIVAATILAGLATSVSAQTYYERGYPDRGYPVYRGDRFADAGEQECYNPRAGHFERVRPGEFQDDLDFRRCRMIGNSGYSNYPNDDRVDLRARRDWREAREECWNPRARHYEEVRRGERQDDLDFGRCRVFRG